MASFLSKAISLVSPRIASSPLFLSRSLATSVQSPRKLRMIILGAPGAGKGTQGARLLERWDISTVGVGDLLRREIKKGTPLGARAEEVMKAGALLPDDIVLKLVEPELRALKDKDWILDGFPRKASQAVLLDMLLANYGDELNFVVNLEVPDEVILERIEGRWLHTASGRVYNASFNPPKIHAIDDITGEPLTRRPDDTAEIFGKRLASYHLENDQLLSHYANAHVSSTVSDGKPLGKLVRFQGRTSDEIYPQLEKVVRERFPDLPLKQ